MISSQPRYDHFDTCLCVCDALCEQNKQYRIVLELARKTAGYGCFMCVYLIYPLLYFT